MINWVLHYFEGSVNLIWLANMKEKGANPTTEDYGQTRRSVVKILAFIILRFIEDLGVEEACHGELWKDEETESTQHGPSASFLVHPKLSQFFWLWFPVFELFSILHTLSMITLFFFLDLILLIRCLEVILVVNDITIWARIWTWVYQWFILTKVDRVTILLFLGTC